MPDIKKYSTGRLGNSWPKHPNTDHVNTKGLDLSNTPGIEAYIDEDIVRAYDDNRPLVNLLSNDEIISKGLQELSSSDNSFSAIIKRKKEDWHLKVGAPGIFSNPEDFSRRISTTPLFINTDGGTTKSGKFITSTAKKLAGFKRTDGTEIWVNEHEWFYSQNPILDDPSASYIGFYRPIYTDVAPSSIPEDGLEKSITLRQRYTTGAVFSYPIYLNEEMLIPYQTSVFEIQNEESAFYSKSAYPGYNHYPDTYSQLTSNNLGNLEVGEDTEIQKNLRKQEYKVLANEFNAEAGAFKAEIKSDFFRLNKTGNISRIENDTNFIRTLRGIDSGNNFSKVYFADHKSPTGVLIPIKDNRDFLGDMLYSLDVQIGNKNETIKIKSPETRGYVDIARTWLTPEDIFSTGGTTFTSNFRIRVNNDEDAHQTVSFQYNNPTIYQLAEAINESFDANDVYAKAIVVFIGEPTNRYKIRIYSRSSGDYSKISILPGTSDLAAALSSNYEAPVDGRSNWYIYRDSTATYPDIPDAGTYEAIRSGGTTTQNDFEIGTEYETTIGYQLFQNMVANGFDNFTVGITTNTEDPNNCKLYIKDNNASRGYINLNLSIPDLSLESGLDELSTYLFSLDIDGSGFEEYQITTTTDTTYNGVFNVINNTLQGKARILTTPIGDTIIESDGYGENSYVKTADGVSGTNLFGAAYPAAGFTPVGAHSLEEFGTGRQITVRATQQTQFTIFKDSKQKRAIYTQNDSILYITPDNKTDIRDHIDTEHAYKSRLSNGMPESRWSTHNDKVIQIDLSKRTSWIAGAKINCIKSLTIGTTKVLFVGNTKGQVFYIDETENLYTPYFLDSKFKRFESSLFADISTEKINNFFVYRDTINNKEFLFVMSDTNILWTETTTFFNPASVFTRINTSSSLSVSNVSAPVFSEIRSAASWRANISQTKSNNYIIFVGKSDSESNWEKAPILYALYNTATSSFLWYAEEIYNKTQIDDITSITRFHGWEDPRQAEQIFISNNANNSPEIWSANSQNNDVNLGSLGDDRFVRFSWMEINQEQGHDHLKLDHELDRIEFLQVYDNKMFLGGTRKDENEMAGLYSISMERLQKYFAIDTSSAYYDEEDTALYINATEGFGPNSDPSILKIDTERDDGRVQIFSSGDLNTVSNWPSDSAFRVEMKGFFVGGINFDGEYNIKFNGQGKSNIFEIVDAINGSEDEGFRDARNSTTGVASNISPVIRARALINYIQSGNTYSPRYRIVIESKIPEDHASGHTSFRETTNSDCELTIKYPTIGTTVVGLGNDTMEIEDGTWATSNLKLVDWENAKATHVRRKATTQISFAGSSYINLSPFVGAGFEILSGSLRVRTNENDELGFVQGRGRIIKTDTPTGLNDDDTKYGLKIIFNENVAPAGQAQITTIEILDNDIDGSTASRSFGINSSIHSSPYTEHYVWLNVDRLSIDPGLAGNPIEVHIEKDMNSSQIAARIASKLDSMNEFSASVAGATITIENSDVGLVAEPTQNDLNVNITTTQLGEDPGYKTNWIMITGQDAQTMWQLKEQIDTQLIDGICSMQNLGSTSEFVDIVISSSLIGSQSSVRIEKDERSGSIDLTGTNALNLTPNRSIQGSTALNTVGSQTLGFTWENTDYFYENSHESGQKRIYIPNGLTRIDAGATVWVDFWEYRQLDKIPAKNEIDENNVPEPWEWTLDLEQKKIVVGVEPKKDFPADFILMDGRIEKTLAKLDLGNNLPVNQEQLSDRFHLTAPRNLSNSEITLSRSVARISSLHYGIKLLSTDTSDSVATNYSFFLPRTDIIEATKYSDSAGQRARFVKGQPDPVMPYVEIPLYKQEDKIYPYAVFVNTSNYRNNNILETRWYNSRNYNKEEIILDGSTEYFKTENDFVSTRGLKPLYNIGKIDKTVEIDDYSLVELIEPINHLNYRKRNRTEIPDYTKCIFLDEMNGNNVNSGTDPVLAVQTLQDAINKTSSARRNIIILENVDKTSPVFEKATINRGFPISIIAIDRATIRGLDISSEVYLEGINVTGQATPVQEARITLLPGHKFSAKYCTISWIQTSATAGTYEHGLKINLENSTIKHENAIKVDGGNFAQSIDVKVYHVYFEKAEVARFYPASYNTGVSNRFEFNNITNGLEEPGYIIDCNVSTSISFEFNRSLLISGTATKFASSASVALTNCISYTAGNNEAHGTGPILINDSRAVEPGQADIIKATGAQKSIARGFEQDSAGLEYAESLYDVGAFIESRKRNKREREEFVENTKSSYICSDKRIEYRKEIVSDKISFYIRFKPLGHFQQQGVIFDSRYSGDFNPVAGLFNVNSRDFFQIVYDNKTYGVNYLSTDRYSFKLIASNGLATYACLIGPQYSIADNQEFNQWHELAIQIDNTKIYNPKYEAADLSSELDRYRHQTVFYTLFDRKFDKVFTPRNNIFEDSGSNIVESTRWIPGLKLTSNFNVAGGWSSDWVETPSGRAWSTWAESTFKMLVDDFLISNELMPLNILASIKEKRIVDSLENDYKVALQDDKYSILNTTCDNSHPYSETGIEPFDGYSVNFRPYEGYEHHAIAVENKSDNLVPFGHIKAGQWFDRASASEWNSDLEIFAVEPGDSSDEIFVVANDGMSLKGIFINTRTKTITDEVVIATRANEAVLKTIGEKYVISYIEESDDKLRYRVVSFFSHTLGTARLVVNAPTSSLSISRCHSDNSIALFYQNDSRAWAQTYDISTNSIINGPVEIGLGEDVKSTSVIESISTDNEESLLFVYATTTENLNSVMYSKDLSTIILSHDTIVADEWPNDIDTVALDNSNILIKYTTPTPDELSSEYAVNFLTISKARAIIVPKTNVFAQSAGADTNYTLKQKDSNILFVSTNTSQEVEYRMYSQTGDELETSSMIRKIDEYTIDFTKPITTYPHKSRDLVTSFSTDSVNMISILENNIPSKWYKDSTGVYDAYMVEVLDTKTFFGKALHMHMNHTTSTGETGIFVADAETEDLSQFDVSIQDGGQILATAESRVHGSFGFEFAYNGTDEELRLEKALAISDQIAYARFYINLDRNFSLFSPTESERSIEIARFGNSTDPLIVELVYNDPLTGGDGGYKLRGTTNSFGTSETATSVVRYQINTCIDIQWENAIAGGWKIYVNENLVLEQSEDTNSLSGIDIVSIGSTQNTDSYPTSISKIFFDDIVVDSEFIGLYTAGMGQGVVWTEAEIQESLEKHILSGYYYIVSGTTVIELDGPAVGNNKIEVEFDEDGNFVHKSYNFDSVIEIKTRRVNWNFSNRFEIHFVPESTGRIDVKVKTANSADDLLIDDFVVDNIKLEKNDFVTSIDANKTGFIEYPAGLRKRGSAFFRVKPEFLWSTAFNKTIFSAFNLKEDGSRYNTHHLYYDASDWTIKFRVYDSEENFIELKTERFGDATIQRQKTNLNDRHTIVVNWDIIRGVYELYLDGEWYELKSSNIDEELYRNSLSILIGNTHDRQTAADCLFDLFRFGENTLDRRQVEILDKKLEPFASSNKTNIGNVTVKSLSFYGLHESDKATIFAERKDEKTSLIIEVGNDYEDEVVIRGANKDIAIFNLGGLEVNGKIKANILEVRSITSMAVYDDHITLRYGFTGTPPDYNDGYLEVERGTLTNSEIRWRESQDSWVFHDGTNNNISIDGTRIGTWKSADDLRIVSNSTGEILFSTNSNTDTGLGDGTSNRTDGTNRFAIGPVESVINRLGNNHDFRIAALSGTHDRIRDWDYMLFADADERRVLIGRNDSTATSGSLVVNNKATIQSDTNTTTGTLEFLNDSGLQAGWIGGGNGTTTWNMQSNLTNFRFDAVNYEVVLSSTAINSLKLTTAGGMLFESNGADSRVDWQIQSTQVNSWRTRTQGGVRWLLEGTAAGSTFDVDIQNTESASARINTNGGIILRSRTTDTSNKIWIVTNTNASASSIHLDTIGGVLVNVREGFRVEEQTNSSFYHLNTSGRHIISTNSTAADSIVITTAGGIQLSSGAQPTTISSNSGIGLYENSGSQIVIASNGATTVSSVNGISLSETTSNASFTISTAGVVTATSAASSSLSLATAVTLQSANSAGANITIHARNNGTLNLTSGGTATTTAPSIINRIAASGRFRIQNSSLADILDITEAGVAALNCSQTTVSGNVTIGATDRTAHTTLRVLAGDAHNASIELYGSSQGTGRVYVGQSTTHGGGIEYNGDNVPATTGAGADYITLFRRSNGVDEWTARNFHNSNDWEFRGNVTVGGSITFGSISIPYTSITGTPIRYGGGTFSATAGGFVTITHNLGTTGYRVSVTPTSNAGGYLGEFWVANKTATSFRVYKSGTASGATFDWVIIQT